MEKEAEGGEEGEREDRRMEKNGHEREIMTGKGGGVARKKI